MNAESLAAAFLVGLLGGVHCLGMCGGIVGALTSGLAAQLRVSRGRFVMALLAYNGGRISSYTLAGVIAGVLGRQAAQLPWLEGYAVGRILAAVIMILFGLYLAGWWHALLLLERAGARLWKHIEPLGRRLIPVQNAAQAYLLGLVWGWLPCGMVYAVLALALSSGSAAGGGAIMLVFGLGTLPVMLSLGLAFSSLGRLLQHRGLRTLAGALVILLGMAMLLANPPGHGHHSPPSHETGHGHQGH
ncbi:MAG: sulfite exporter TauE/SafE family protein [Gammaproteobacteria bacterium]|jgi:sulfite exporter TauE/SafE